MMTYYANSNGDIQFVRGGTDKQSLEEIPEPPSDATVNGGNTTYKYDPEHSDANSNGFYVPNTPPGPEEAYAQIENRLIDEEFSSYSDPELEAMELLDNYSSAVSALKRGNYERVARYVRNRVVPNESELDNAFADFVDELLQVDST